MNVRHKSAFQEIRANLFELLVRNAQSLVDVVLECAIDLVQFVYRSLKEFGALEQLRLEVYALAETSGADQRIVERAAVVTALVMRSVRRLPLPKMSELDCTLSSSGSTNHGLPAPSGWKKLVVKRRTSPIWISLRHSAPQLLTHVRVCCAVSEKRASLWKSDTARPPMRR